MGEQECGSPQERCFSTPVLPAVATEISKNYVGIEDPSPDSTGGEFNQERDGDVPNLMILLYHMFIVPSGGSGQVDIIIKILLKPQMNIKKQ